ncbi:M20/M25/M40 family metallo-hydrolase [Nakamurella flava]|uniref:M20/M25/M40 family metallo-hydrolase n=1 Tax=Nakamurella flava TaxID=2576308 RepID=A0A4U6QGD9_9ACTN|nr:M20/M25/M40 family metallo-hydrolase [Nakamurella flava]TKV59211.1 M20/M25/M40 family metallo-hydrolase [Nakamurella flava]
MTPPSADVARHVDDLLPALLDDLRTLIALPSIAFPGYPSEPVDRAADAVVDLLRRSGLSDARLLEIPDGYPAVYGEIPAPPGAPTVLLYAHYDVQPAPAEQGWKTDPFTPTDGPDGRIYGRGAADDKSGVVIHAGTLQVLTALAKGAAGRAFPIGVRVLIEGEEETVSHLEEFVEHHPELVQCDAFVIADMGNQSVGRPALTTTLRGDVSCTVSVRTLDHPLHSGLFGGPVPDALVALIRMLATLHDEHGNTVIPGVTSRAWDGAEPDEQVFRASAELADGVQLIGDGSLGSRLYSKPSATVLGIDAPTVAGSSNVLIPHARAKVSLRIVPGSDAGREQLCLLEHLRSVAPWGVQVEVEPVAQGWPFAVDETHPAVQAAESALVEAFGGAAVERLGCGGSIPLINTLAKVCPGAGVILWGAEDMARARIHASDESVDPAEIGRLVVAQVLTLLRLADPAAG